MLLTPIPHSYEGENEISAESHEFQRAEGPPQITNRTVAGNNAEPQEYAAQVNDLGSHHSDCMGACGWKVNENLR